MSDPPSSQEECEEVDSRLDGGGCLAQCSNGEQEEERSDSGPETRDGKDSLLRSETRLVRKCGHVDVHRQSRFWPNSFELATASFAVVVVVELSSLLLSILMGVRDLESPRTQKVINSVRSGLYTHNWWRLWSYRSHTT